MTNDTTRFADLKARLATINCELMEHDGDGEDRFYVLDKELGKLVSVGQSLDDTYDWLEDESSRRSPTIADEITGSQSPEEDAPYRSESCAVIYFKDTDVHSVLHGIHGIAKALDGEAIDSGDVSALHSALVVLTSQLYSAVYDVPSTLLRRAIKSLAAEVSK